MFHINLFTAIKMAVAVPLAFLASVVGGSGWLFLLFVVCAAADWITGSMKALKSGGWSSTLAREGLWHKTGEFASVFVALCAEIVINYVNGQLNLISLPCRGLLFTIVCVWYICTELGSIIENAGELGAPVPGFLKSMIKVLKTRIDESGKNFSVDDDTLSDDTYPDDNREDE